MTEKGFNSIKAATVALALMQPSSENVPFTILGSGFCVDSSGLIVTCQHVISAFTKKSILEQIAHIPPDERNKKLHSFEVEVLKPFALFYTAGRTSTEILAIPVQVDQIMARLDYDFGLVRILKHAFFKNGYPTVEISPYSDLFEGIEIGTYGFPLGNYLHKQMGSVTSSLTCGRISSIIPAPSVEQSQIRGFQLDLTATYGNSGGPVFSLESKKVFGILQGGPKDPTGKIVAGLARAEPVWPLLLPKDLELLKSAPQGRLPDRETLTRHWNVPEDTNTP